uniref:NAD(P)-binding protein n=1 Tax=Mycena chlorophos TaxID=658473 RepID=A0ABQ0MEI8_MYCCL|nr:NAD(P)-binding protein [Mycena chlorophos]
MGVIWSQFFPPKATFSVDDIPDLTGQVMLVTGGNSGIGKEIVKGLLAHNAKVYLAARNAESAKMAIAELKTQTGHDAEFLEIDLADLGSIKRAAEEFTRKEKQLNVLFNNGGVMASLPVVQLDMLTKQGYDLQFGTNVLGHFYLTKLLLPTLITTAKDSGKPTRVVNTSSLVLEGAAKFDFATFKESPARAKLGTSGLYQQSKFGNAVFSAELHRRYAEQGIVSIALNPGNIMTNLGRYLSPGFLRILKYIVYDPPLGALTPLYAGTVKEGDGFGGKFLFPWARMGQVPAAVDDANNGRELWTWYLVTPTSHALSSPRHERYALQRVGLPLLLHVECVSLLIIPLTSLFVGCSQATEPGTDGSGFCDGLRGHRKSKRDPREKALKREFMARDYRRDGATGRIVVEQPPGPITQMVTAPAMIPAQAETPPRTLVPKQMLASVRESPSGEADPQRFVTGLDVS